MIEKETQRRINQLMDRLQRIGCQSSQPSTNDCPQLEKRLTQLEIVSRDAIDSLVRQNNVLQKKVGGLSEMMTKYARTMDQQIEQRNKMNAKLEENINRFLQNDSTTRIMIERKLKSLVDSQFKKLSQKVEIETERQLKAKQQLIGKVKEWQSSTSDKLKREQDERLLKDGQVGMLWEQAASEINRQLAEQEDSNDQLEQTMLAQVESRVKQTVKLLNGSRQARKASSDSVLRVIEQICQKLSQNRQFNDNQHSIRSLKRIL